MPTGRQANQKMPTIKLSPHFYSKEALKAAIREFRPLCRIEFTERRGRFFVSFKKTKTVSLERLANEFCNYLLAQTIIGRYENG